jgi:hypothetical protein
LTQALLNGTQPLTITAKALSKLKEWELELNPETLDRNY